MMVACTLAAESKVDVLELVDLTFQKFVKSHRFVLVYFYAPWCEHCKEFAPKFEAAANVSQQRSLPFVFTKMDANSNYYTRSTYGIEEYPSLRIFIDGEPIVYRRDNSVAAIIDFLTVKARVFLVKELTTKAEALSVIKGKGLRVSRFISNPGE